MIMEEKNNEKLEEQLPFCRTASVAEHARGHDEDEPCDDYRGRETAKD
jgi:hypothetical protein